jgi:hypothetical protein
MNAIWATEQLNNLSRVFGLILLVAAAVPLPVANSDKPAASAVVMNRSDFGDQHVAVDAVPVGDEALIDFKITLYQGKRDCMKPLSDAVMSATNCLGNSNVDLGAFDRIVTEHAQTGIEVVEFPFVNAKNDENAQLWTGKNGQAQDVSEMVREKNQFEEGFRFSIRPQLNVDPKMLIVEMSVEIRELKNFGDSATPRIGPSVRRISTGMEMKFGNSAAVILGEYPLDNCGSPGDPITVVVFTPQRLARK